MNRADLDEIKMLLERELRPLRRDIEALQAVDQRHDTRLGSHSGLHRDLSANVRKSLAEVKETTNADLLAATQHLSGLIESYRKSNDEKLAFVNAQVEALKQVPAQAAASANAAIDTKAEVQRGNKASRLHAWAAVIAFVIIQVIEHFAK